MSEFEVISQSFGCFDQETRNCHLVRKNGRVLLALPKDREAALRTLSLYQPQRKKAKILSCGLALSIRLGLHQAITTVHTITPRSTNFPSGWDGSKHGTLGLLLGSPEHRVQRAIASYRYGDRWEVAKISFGTEGHRNLEEEASVLETLGTSTPGVPASLGLHHHENITFLRMPYLTGKRLGDSSLHLVLGLLKDWMSGDDALPIQRFPEWQAIASILEGAENGLRAKSQIQELSLVPTIRHGDCARWNLLAQSDGRLLALDWEWGHPKGMPCLDLVHYVLQDARLIDGLSAEEAVRKAAATLQQPDCKRYLRECGWNKSAHLAIITSLAWKEGAKHQENREILSAALATWPSGLDEP